MRFKCGKTQAELDALILAQREYRAATSRWHKFYPIFPRRVARGDCRAFEYIERRYDWDWDRWHYRELGSTDHEGYYS